MPNNVIVEQKHNGDRWPALRWVVTATGPGPETGTHFCCQIRIDSPCRESALKIAAAFFAPCRPELEARLITPGYLGLN